MIDIVRSLKGHTAYGQRFFGFFGAFLAAEFFYKFHSFALECIAFLLTWLVFDWLIEKMFGTPKSKPDKKAYSA